MNAFVKEYYMNRRSVGLDDYQIAKSLGIDMKALKAMLSEEHGEVPEEIKNTEETIFKPVSEDETPLPTDEVEAIPEKNPGKKPKKVKETEPET